MPFEEFSNPDQRKVARALRDLAQAIEAGYVTCHSYDLAGEHPSQPELMEVTLYLKRNASVAIAAMKVI